MNRDLVLLATSMLIWGFGESMFYEFRPLVLQQLGADPLLIGIVLGGVGAAMSLSHIPAGYLSDRIGRRPLIYAAWILGCIATWIMVWADGLGWFAFGIIVYGFTYFVSGPFNGYVTAARGSLSVGRAITLVAASFSLGGILGPVFGGWVAEHFGLKAPMFVAGILFIISTVVVLFIQPQPPTLKKEEHLHALRSLFNRRYISFLVVIFLAMFVMYLPQPLSPIFLQHQRGIRIDQIGIFLGLTGLGVVLLNLALGHLKASLGFLLAQVALLAFVICLWLGNTWVWYSIGYFLMGGYRTARSLAAAQGRVLFDEKTMGMGYGSIEAVVAAAIILAPPLAGWLYSQSPNWLYAVSAGLLVVSLAFTTWLTANKSENTY